MNKKMAAALFLAVVCILSASLIILTEKVVEQRMMFASSPAPISAGINATVQETIVEVENGG